MINQDLSFFYYIVLFAIYCFIGWVLEVFYRSFKQRKFVNAGFIFGPFVPIYGIGAFIVIVLQYFIQNWHFIPRYAALGLSITFVEYIVGFLAEKIFKIAEVFEITEVERKRLVKNKTELTAGSTNDYSTNVLRRQSSSLRKPSKKRTKVQAIF